MEIFPDPTIESWQEARYYRPTENYLTINGEHLNDAANERDVKVRIWHLSLPVDDVPNQLSFEYLNYLGTGVNRWCRVYINSNCISCDNLSSSREETSSSNWSWSRSYRIHRPSKVCSSIILRNEKELEMDASSIIILFQILSRSSLIFDSRSLFHFNLNHCRCNLRPSHSSHSSSRSLSVSSFSYSYSFIESMGKILKMIV